MTDFSINPNNIPQIGNIDTNAIINEAFKAQFGDQVNNIPQTVEQAEIENAGDKKSDDIQKEIEDLKDEKADIQEKINKKEAEVLKGKVEIETIMAKAMEAEKKAVKDYQKEVDKIVEDSKQAYKKANQEGGKGMTQEQLTSIINKAVPGSPDLSKSIAYQLMASKLLENVCNLSDEVDQLQNEINGIDIDINAKNNEYEQALTNEKQAQQAQDTQNLQQTGDEDATTQQQAPKVNCIKDLETNIYQAMLQNISNAFQTGGLEAVMALSGGNCGGGDGSGGGYSQAELHEAAGGAQTYEEVLAEAQASAENM